MKGKRRSERLLENRDRLATALVRAELLKACGIPPRTWRTDPSSGS